MSQQIERIERRTQQYWYEDGLVEMSIGLLFTLIGVLLYVQFQLEPGWQQAVLLAVVMPVLIIGGTLLSKRVVQALKDRITYPRTGYIAYRREEGSIGGRGRYVIIGFAALLAAAVLTADIIWDDFPFNHIALAEGLLMAAIMGYLGLRFGIVRLMLVAGLSAVLGIAVPLSGIGEAQGSAIVFGAVGLALLVFGALALRRYLHDNPLPESADDDQ